MATPRKKVTSSAERSKRQKASKAKVSGANPSSRANRQKVSTAKVTADSTRSSNAGKGAAKVTTGKGATPAAKSPGLLGTRTPLTLKQPYQAPKPNFKGPSRYPRTDLAPKGPPMPTGAKGPRPATIKGVASEVARNAGKAAVRAGARAAVRLAPAVAALNAGKVADGTLKGKPRLSADRPSGKPNAKEKATAASFDKSFKRARSMGSKVFMWRGKRYTTKRKDDK